MVESWRVYSEFLEVFVKDLGKVGDSIQCKGTDIFTLRIYASKGSFG